MSENREKASDSNAGEKRKEKSKRISGKKMPEPVPIWKLLQDIEKDEEEEESSESDEEEASVDEGNFDDDPNDNPKLELEEKNKKNEILSDENQNNDLMKKVQELLENVEERKMDEVETKKSRYNIPQGQQPNIPQTMSTKMTQPNLEQRRAAHTMYLANKNSSASLVGSREPSSAVSSMAESVSETSQDKKIPDWSRISASHPLTISKTWHGSNQSQQIPNKQRGSYSLDSKNSHNIPGSSQKSTKDAIGKTSENSEKASDSNEQEKKKETTKRPSISRKYEPVPIWKLLQDIDKDDQEASFNDENVDNSNDEPKLELEEKNKKNEILPVKNKNNDLMKKVQELPQTIEKCKIDEVEIKKSRYNPPQAQQPNIPQTTSTKMTQPTLEQRRAIHPMYLTNKNSSASLVGSREPSSGHKTTDARISHSVVSSVAQSVSETPQDKKNPDSSRSLVPTPATILNSWHGSKNFQQTPNQPQNSYPSASKSSYNIPGSSQKSVKEAMGSTSSGQKVQRKPLGDSILNYQQADALPQMAHNAHPHLPHSVLPRIPENINEQQGTSSMVKREPFVEYRNENKCKRSIFPNERQDPEAGNGRNDVSVSKMMEGQVKMTLDPRYSSQYSRSSQPSNYASAQAPLATAPKAQPCVVPYMAPTHSRQNEIVVIRSKQYQVLGVIGKGMSGEVLRALDLTTDQFCAIKRVDFRRLDTQGRQGCLDEVGMLNKLQGPNIVRMFSSEIQGHLLYVVMELGETDLSQLLKDFISVNKKLPIIMVLFYWLEMLKAVKFIHDNGVIHSDLKPANFILVKGRIKLIDFGIASNINPDMTSVIKDSLVGTLNYISPEQLGGTSPSDPDTYKVSRKSDVWALGCILYSLIFGTTPFSQYRNQFAKINAIKDKNTPISYTRSDAEDKDEPSLRVLINVTRKCLLHNPRERPSVDQLLAVPYTSFSRPGRADVQDAPTVSPTILAKIKTSNCLSEAEWRQLMMVLDRTRQA